MNAFNLSLRQRQLINYLQHAKGYVTGEDLAQHLSTSSRTIRSDISEINKLLADQSVQIQSRHRYGYILQADDPACLRTLTQAAESYISRPERLRHILLRLCLSDTPIDLDELADEMFISKTTLEHDLKSFRKRYLLTTPSMQMLRNKNQICFENNEWKRRVLLCRLYADSWNYNDRGNIFFQYEYLQEDNVNCCIERIQHYMNIWNIHIEDANMVHLDLQIAIAIQRIADGHPLTTCRSHPYITAPAREAVNALLDDLGDVFSCPFTQPEREDIMEMVSCTALPNMDDLRAANLAAYFQPALIHLADRYLAHIREVYHLDFTSDEDFYLTLLIYLRYQSLPFYYMNLPSGERNQLIRQYAIEFELAFAFEPFALEFYGSYLNFAELHYLSLLFAGAMIRRPFTPLRTIILTQYNLPASWNLRMNIEDIVARFLQIDTLLPIHAKDTYDFSNTDLALVTAQKSLNLPNHVDLLHISARFDVADKEALSQYILRRRYASLYGHDYAPIAQLLNQALWYEHVEENDLFNLLTWMGQNLTEAGCVGMSYLTDLLHRYSLSSFIIQPSFILLYSSVPAARTCIEAVTLEHRIRIEGYKVRTIFMFCMQQEDIGLLFKLYNDLYQGIANPNETRFFKTKEEWTAYLSSS